MAHNKRASSEKIVRPTKRLRTVDATDQVIEQWYADPYDRDDPFGPTPTIQRRQNLENAMRNNGLSKDQDSSTIMLIPTGFAYSRAVPIVNWLMYCNGRIRDFENTGKRRNRRNSVPSRSENKSIAIASPEVVNGIDTCEKGRRDSQHDDESISQMGLNLSQRSVDYDEKSDVVQDLEHHDYQDMPSQQELQELIGDVIPSIESKFQPQMMDEDELIRTLTHRLRVFDIIYGDQLPAPDDSLEFSWSQSSAPRTVRSRKSQGHLPLKEVEFMGKMCETEDPTFGMLNLTATEVATLEEQQEFVRKNKSTSEKSLTDDMGRISRLERGRYDSFSNGFRETWKEIAGMQEVISRDAFEGTNQEDDG